MEHRNLPGLLVFLELVSGASSARAVVDDDEEQGCAGRGEERAVLRWPRGQGAHTRSSSSDKATGTDGALSNEVVRRLELLPGVLRSPTRSSSTVQHHLALALPSPKSGGKVRPWTPRSCMNDPHPPPLSASSFVRLSWKAHTLPMPTACDGGL